MILIYSTIFVVGMFVGFFGVKYKWPLYFTVILAGAIGMLVYDLLRHSSLVQW